MSASCADSCSQHIAPSLGDAGIAALPSANSLVHREPKLLVLECSMAAKAAMIHDIKVVRNRQIWLVSVIVQQVMHP